MNNTHSDLRDALRRITPPSSPLSEDFVDQLMEKSLELRTQERGTASENPFLLRLNRYRRMAAILIAAVFLGALAWASIQILTPYNPPVGDEKVGSLQTPPTGGLRGASPHRFSDVRLDSILSVVAAHYKQQVQFLDEAPRNLRFTITWDREDSLATFITMLNEFDGLQVTEERDTVFVKTLPSPSLKGKE